MIDPFLRLYRIAESIDRKVSYDGGRLASLVVLVAIGGFWLGTGLILNSLFANASVTKWLNNNWYWPVGGTVLAFSVYTFVRHFFETTTGKSEADVRAWRSQHD